jgi:hypothetical protein
MKALNKLPRRNTNDIVIDIVNECRDASVEGLVRTLISGLEQEIPPLWGNRKVNEEYAIKLRRRIDKLEATLKAVPEGFPLFLLFAPERFLSLFFLAQFPAGQGATVEIPSEIDDNQPETRWEQLAEKLAKLRAQCDWIIELQIGEHGSAGYQQERAAIASREVMERCGLPLTCSPTSKYCLVASRFFETMTGEYDRDLRRACEVIARAPLCTEKPSKS